MPFSALTRVSLRDVTTLLETVQHLSEAPADATLYAARPWTPQSEAVVASADVAPPGMDYLLEVTLAREAIEVWSRWREGAAPTDADACAALVYYAENDAFMPSDGSG